MLVRRLGWLVLVCGLLAVPRAAQADQVVYADFDGDGRRDRASVDSALPSVVRVWLSSTQKVGFIRADRPLLQLAARDLDGDGRPELIASDVSARLFVWKAYYRNKLKVKFKFKQYRAMRTAPASSPPPPHGVEDTASAVASAESGSDSYSAFDVTQPFVFGSLGIGSLARVSDERFVLTLQSSPSTLRGPPPHR